MDKKLSELLNNEITEDVSREADSVTSQTPSGESMDVRELSESDQIKLIKKIGGNFVFFYGKRTSGKSAILSSIVYSLRRGDLPGSCMVRRDGVFQNGTTLESLIAKLMREGRLLSRTNNDITYLGLQFTPERKNLPKLDVTFLEMSGEDLETIEVNSTGLGVFPKYIDVFFKISNLPMLFLLVTPWFDAQDDDIRISQFIDYINSKNKTLLAKSQFMLLISQWDDNPNNDQDVEEFVLANMPTTYSLIKDHKNIVNEYTIGNVIIADSLPMVEEFNRLYPAYLWKQIYKTFTGKSLDKNGPFARFFGT